MWNPHPTISKPVPIGKKHTNQPRTKARQRQENTQHKRNLEIIRIKREFKDRVSAYWQWKIEDYPILQTNYGKSIHKYKRRRG
jgi:hypothetical protein